MINVIYFLTFFFRNFCSTIIENSTCKKKSLLSFVEIFSVLVSFAYTRHLHRYSNCKRLFLEELPLLGLLHNAFHIFTICGKNFYFLVPTFLPTLLKKIKFELVVFNSQAKCRLDVAYTPFFANQVKIIK